MLRSGDNAATGSSDAVAEGADARPARRRAEPHRVILPRSNWLPVHLAEIWEAREVFLRLAAKEVTLRYRQTALGVIWVILQPLIAAAIFTVVFGRVARLPSEGLPYLVFSYAGLMGWTAFSTTLTRASSSLVVNSALVSKVFFPRILLPLSVLWSALIDFGVAMVVMAVMLVVFKIQLTAAVLLIPAWLLLLLVGAMGAGLIAGSVMVRYRDMQYVVPVAAQMLLFASPVAYSLAAVPASTRLFFTLNPLSAVMEGFRWSLLGAGQLGAGEVAYSVAGMLLVFMLGLVAFSRLERDFADVI
jgi:lipopolysaccharide transport system permease protein